MNESVLFVLKCAYFMLPAYLANMTPVLVKKIPFLDYPIDFNKKLRGKPILGTHKTIRGIVFGVIAGIVIASIQFSLQAYPFFRNLSFIDYSNWLAIGFLLGFGALVGDSVKSFFKRRSNIKPGKSFFPWDQLDYSIGSLLFVSFIFLPSWQIALTIIILNLILHIAANHAAYYLRLSKVKW